MLAHTGGTYRAFEVSDDSMLPIEKGTTIVGRYVQDWASIAPGTPCIVVSPTVGITFKRVTIQGDTLHLAADNLLHDASEASLFDLTEIWEAKAYISSTFPIEAPTLDHLRSMVLDLQDKVKLLHR